MQRSTPPRAGTSFAARFGRVILQHGIAPLPSALYHFQGALGLSAQQVWFVSYILAHKWDADLPYPSLKKMADRTRLSLRQLQRIRASLEATGDLQVGTQFGTRGGQDANTYDFAGLFARLETVLAAAPRPANPIRGEDRIREEDAGAADNSFIARFGRVIARYGVAAVPWALFTHQAALDLTPQQVWFTCYIFSFQWDTGWPYPSIRRMAEATGYSTVQLHTIKAELIAAGHLRLVHRTGADGGQDTNAYDFSALLEALTLQLRHTEATPQSECVAETAPPPAQRRRGRRQRESARPAPGRYAGDGITVIGGDDTGLIGEDDTELPGRNGLHRSGGDDTGLSGGDDIQLSWGGGEELTGRADRRFTGGDGGDFAAGHQPLSGTGMTGGFPGGMTRGYPEEEPVHTEPLHQEDSNPRARGNQGNGTREGIAASAYVAAVVMDFSRELDDPTHTAANVTQALRLHAADGRSEQAFVALLYEARRRTRQAQGQQGQGMVANKMAYFFQVLRRLVDEVSERSP